MSALRTLQSKSVVPKASLGPCVWMPEPGGEQASAIVTRVGSVISCIVFADGSSKGRHIDSVRHASDPEYAKYAHLNNGCWDFTEDQKAIIALAARSASVANLPVQL